MGMDNEFDADIQADFFDGYNKRFSNIAVDPFFTQGVSHFTIESSPTSAG